MNPRGYPAPATFPAASILLASGEVPGSKFLIT